MATGTAFGGRCYVSAAEAVDAYYSAKAPDVVSGSISYMTIFMKDSDVWKSQTFSRSGVSPWSLDSVQLAPVPTLPACQSDSERFLDGQTIGWSIAAVLAVVWGFQKMKEQAR